MSDFKVGDKVFFRLHDMKYKAKHGTIVRYKYFMKKKKEESKMKRKLTLLLTVTDPSFLRLALYIFAGNRKVNILICLLFLTGIRCRRQYTVSVTGPWIWSLRLLRSLPSGKTTKRADMVSFTARSPTHVFWRK